jgi:hypothetical protein
VAYRCVGLGTSQRVVAFPAFAAVALAGLHDVPDTIASRAIVVRMWECRSEVAPGCRSEVAPPLWFVG